MEELQALAGLGGAPTVVQFVEWLKNDVGFPKKWSPVAAILGGIIFNIVVGVLLGTALQLSLGLGVLTGLVASGWYDLAKRKTQ